MDPLVCGTSLSLVVGFNDLRLQVIDFRQQIGKELAQREGSLEELFHFIFITNNPEKIPGLKLHIRMRIEEALISSL